MALVGGVVSPDYCVFRDLVASNVKYYEFLFKTPLLVGEFARLSKGIGSGFNRLYTDDFGSISIAVPCVSEQNAIVCYLSSVDRRVRRYVRAKERLIGLLEEEKQAIINQAVTRGLDPSVRLKASGVEWLGDVPEHWEVRRVKSLSSVRRGASPRPIDDPRYFDDDGEYAWVRISDVSASEHYLEKTSQRLSTIGASKSVKIEPGSLFLSIAASVGKPIVTSIKCCIHDGFVYFPQFKGNVDFLYQVFSCDGPFEKLGKLGTQLNLNTETVGDIRLGWPPVHEQSMIVEYIVQSTAGIDHVIDRNRRQVELVEEYRTRLIADVVTGKLDVREAAERLGVDGEDELGDGDGVGCIAASRAEEAG